jgi:glycosyltransferase involved in cell wall biosynthesis
VRLSAVTITFNEIDHIRSFLSTHGFADELVVVDSGSTDGTIEAATAAGARVIQMPWKGYARQWNAAFNLCGGEWILFGDADHRAPPSLADEIQNAVQRRDAAGFRVARINFYRGRPLFHGGWFPDRKVRLFRKGKARFDETRSVHEQLRVDGACFDLAVPVLHDTYRDFAEALAKINLYTTLEAKDRADRGVRHLWEQSAGLDLRARLGYIRSSLPLAPLLHFLYRYLLRAGFLDGRAGWEMAVLSGFYEFAAGAKRRELTRPATCA